MTVVGRILELEKKSALVSLSRFVALGVFLVFSALAVATLFVSRQPLPAEVSGSPTPPEFVGRTVGNILINGDFVTRAPDGEAHAIVRFNSPEAFARLLHTYRGEVWPQYRLSAAQVQYSDDGTNWTKIGEASNSNGALAFDLREVGAHRFWKFTVVKSGEAAEVVVGQLLFLKDGYRHFIRLLPLDVVWLSLVPASLLLLLVFRIPLSIGRVFIATAIPVTLFVLTYSLGYVDFHSVTSPDSGGYLQRVWYGSYSTTRNIGYPSILLAVHKTVGLDNLAWVQLGACIACYLAGAFLLAIRFNNKWVGAILVIALLLQGSASRFAPDVMTEALFMAGLTLFTAALGVLAWRPDWRATLAAVVGIVLVVLTKSIGIALVVSALLLIRFLPKGSRLRVSGVIVFCGLASYSIMALNAYTRTGSASPESFAGFALIGHVGWMLDDTSMPPSDLTQGLIAAAKPVIEKRPPDLKNIRSMATLDRYVNVTVQEYNFLLWQNLIPVVARFKFTDPVELNSFFVRFGLASIRAHPIDYCRHVVAHFYGMWRDLGQVLQMNLTTVNIRRAFDPYGFRNTIPPAILSPYPSEEIVRAEVMAQANLPLMFQFWSAQHNLQGWTTWLGVVAFFLSILFFVPCRLAYLYRTEIMMALSLNAYFGAHVLLQVTLERYAAVAVLAAIFLAVSFVVTSTEILLQAFSRLGSRGAGPAWRAR